MKKQGFSLMEMMVVLLIVSIVAAASAPVVSKKLASDVLKNTSSSGGTSTCYWLEQGTNGKISYYGDTVAIGSSTVPASANNPKLYVDSNNTSIPQIALAQDGSNIVKISASNTAALSVKTGNISSGSNSVTIGCAAEGSAEGATAVGYYATARAVNSTAIGYNSTAFSKNLVTVGCWQSGRGTEYVGGNSSVAIGYNMAARGNNTIAIGSNAFSSGDNSVALGSYATGNNYAVAIGNSADAEGISSVCIGSSDVSASNRAGNDSVALGYRASAGYPWSIAIGASAITNGANSVAIRGTVYGKDSTVIGAGASAPGANSVAIGNLAHTSYDDSIAIGSNSYAGDSGVSGNNSIAIGANAHSTGNRSIAIGTNANAASTYYGNPGSGYKTSSDNYIVPTGTLKYYNNVIAIGHNATTPKDVHIPKEKGYIKDGDHYWVAFNMFFNGNVNIPGTLYCFTNSETSSDRRLKNIGEKFTSGLEEIKKLKVYNYTFKDDKSKTPRVGVIAQDLKEVFPDAVFKGGDGFYSIRMEDILYAMVNSVIELDKKITAMLKREWDIARLKTRAASLEKRISALEQKIE